MKDELLYTIEIDVELFEEILVIYNKILEDLRAIQKYSDRSMLTGELGDYYNILNSSTDAEKIIKEIIYDYEDIILRTEACLREYETIDSNLETYLNSMITTIFEAKEEEVEELKGMTYEERKDYISKSISNFSDTLWELKFLYEELYEDGIPADQEKVLCFANLLMALGAYSEIMGVSDNEANPYQLYNTETGCINVRELGYAISYCKQKEIIPAIKGYILGEESWCESGLDDLFGENLVKMPWRIMSQPPSTMGVVEENKEYPGGYYGHCAFDSNGNIMYDAESVFIEIFFNNFMDRDYKYKDEAYQHYLEEFGDVISEINEERYEKYGGRYGCQLKNDAYIDGKWYEKGTWIRITDSNFSLTHGVGYNGGVGWCTSIGNKEFAINLLKGYVKKKGIFEILEPDNDDETKNIFESYVEAATLESDITRLSDIIYKYEQYQNLMPYEERRKERNFNSYSNKDYSNYSNELFNSGEYKDWHQYMDQSEVALFDYLYSTSGKGLAKGYLKALSDIVNQRKGYSKAVEFVSNLDEKDTFTYKDASGNIIFDAERYLLSIIAPDIYDAVEDGTTSLTTGLSDGLYNFFDGFNDLVGADGVRSANDYYAIYLMELLKEDNEYNKNLSQLKQDVLASIYQFGNSTGYMAVPTLLNYVPIVGTALSTTTLLASSTGNNTEDLMQQGVDRNTAYVYGALMGLSETAIEMICGGLPGSASNASKGALALAKSAFSEAGEEFVQTYVSAGISSCATGETIDLTDVTGEAFQAAIMSIFTSTAMNGGGKAFIKVADTVVEVSSSQYNTYEEWLSATQAKYRESHPILATLLMGSDSSNNQNINESIEVLDITREEIPNLSDEQKQLISAVTYNNETEQYEVYLISGKKFAVDNLSEVTLENIAIIENDLTLVERITEIMANLSVKDENNNESTNHSENFIKTMSGYVSGLTTDIIKSNNVNVIKANLAKWQINKLTKNATQLTNYIDKLDATILTQTIKNSDGTDITLLEYAWEKGYVDSDPLLGFSTSKIPDVAKTNIEVAKLCINNSDKIDLAKFIDSLNANMLISEVTSKNGETITFLEYAWENGYIDFNNNKGIPVVAQSDADVAKLCIENMDSTNVLRFVSGVEANVLTTKMINEFGESITFLEYAWENGYVGIDNEKMIPSIHQIDADVAKLCIKNIENLNVPEFVGNLGVDVLVSKVLNEQGEPIPFLEYAWENGYYYADAFFPDEKIFIIPNIANENIEIIEICIDSNRINNYDIFKLLSTEFQMTNPDIVSKALEKTPGCLEYISEEFQMANPDIVSKTLENAPVCLEYVSEKFQMANPDIVGKILENAPVCLEYVSEEFQMANPAIVSKTLEISPEILVYVSEEFQMANPAIVSKALENAPVCLEYVSEEFQMANPDIIINLIEKNPESLNLVKNKFQLEHFDRIFEMFESNPEYLKNLGSGIKSSIKVLEYAVKKYGVSYIQYFNPYIFSNDIVNQIKNTPNLLRTIDDDNTKAYINFIQTSSEAQINVLMTWLSKNPYLLNSKFNYELINLDMLSKIGEERFNEMIGCDIAEKVFTLYKEDTPKFDLFCEMVHKLENSSVGNATYFQNYIDNVMIGFDSFEQSNCLNVISEYITNNPKSEDSKFLLNLLWSYTLDPNNKALQKCIADVENNYDLKDIKSKYLKELQYSYETATSKEEKVDILLKAYYGISRDQMKAIIKRYGDSSLGDVSVNPQVENILKHFLEIENGRIKEAFPSLEDYNFDVYEVSILLEQYLKNTYSELYMENTFKTQESEPCEIRTVVVKDKEGNTVEGEFKIYELPDDKIVVVHVEGAFGSNKEGFVNSDNYKESYYDFPEKYALRHHLATSVVSNDKGSVVGTEANIIYGYDSWDVESLIFMDKADLFSKSDGYSIKSEYIDTIEFESPEHLLDHSGNGYTVYNELAFERTGLTPSYLVLYDSMPDEIKQATYQAAYDWQIPIVVIHK